MAFKTKVLLIFFAAALVLSLSHSHAEPFKYDSHGKRDPFVPLIGQERPLASVGFADIASMDDVRLEGIAVSQSGTKTAIINGEMVREGFRAGETEVKKVNKDSVVLSIGGKDYTVKLAEEGGINSEQ